MRKKSLVRLAWIQISVALVFLAAAVFNDFAAPSLQIWYSSQTGLVRDVLPNGTGARAGIMTGDRILTIGETRISDRIAPLYRVAPGEPTTVALSRGSRVVEVSVIPVSTWQARSEALRAGGTYSASAITGYLRTPVNLWMAALGLTIMFLRSGVAAARVSAISLVFWAGGDNLSKAAGAGVLFGSLPLPLAIALHGIDIYFFAAFYALCLHFALLFPEPLPAVRRRPALQLVPYLIAAPIFLESFTHLLRRLSPSLREALPYTGETGFYSLLGPLLLLLAVAVLAVRYRGTADRKLRRRLRLVFASFIPGLSSLILVILVEQFEAPVEVRTTAMLLQWLSVALSSAIYAYAIARHRIFDVRVLIRKSIQYALARGTLIGFMLIPAIALIIFLYTHRDESIMQIVSRQPAVYLTLLISSGLILAYRKRLLTALDRRYFREQYDAREMLTSVISMIRSGSDAAALARAAVNQIERALHPNHSSLWIVAATEGEIRQVLSSGESPADCAALPLSSALATLIGTDEEPLDLDSGGTRAILGRLPIAEKAWMEESKSHLLVPMLVEGHLAGFLLLGEKRSEEPYSKEDRQLLRLIAAQMSITQDYGRMRSSPSLVWSNQITTPISSDELRLCPSCRRCFPREIAICEFDRTALIAEFGIPFEIEDKYQMKRLIGRGGMGAVYQATQLRLQRPVAIKILLSHLVSSSTMRLRFEREARIVARLRHPGIVTIHDFGVLGSGHAFLVMEYVDGRTLREVIRQGAIDHERARLLLAPVAEAIDTAHAAGVIHRDLKPENIVLSPSDFTSARILDFGLARLQEQSPDRKDDEATLLQTTQSGSVLGTLPYMAPELFAGGSATASSDQYAIGVIAYELLSGLHPFAARDLAGIVIGHTQLPVPPLREKAPYVPASVAAAVHRALAKEPSERFGSVKEFVDAWQ